MGDRDAIDAVWSRLRAGAARGDPAAAAAAIPAGVAVGLLQTAVPVAIAALRADTPAGVNPDALVDSLVDALRAREWTGDDIAVESLKAARCGTSTGRVTILADLEMLGDVLGQQLGGYLDRATGDTWQSSLFDDALLDIDPDDEPDQWLPVPGDTHHAWTDMATFADRVADPHLRELLQHAINGRGAFHRFKAALDRHPTYRIDWQVWSSERAMGRARAWLAAEGFDPLP